MTALPLYRNASQLVANNYMLVCISEMDLSSEHSY